MKFQLSTMIGLCVLTTAIPVAKTIHARDSLTEDFQQAGSMDKRDPVSRLDKTSCLGLSSQETYYNYFQGSFEDILHALQIKEPLVIPLIAARSIEPEESLEKRNWLDDFLKIVDETKAPLVVPLIAARSIEPEESLEKRNWLDDILKEITKEAPLIVPIISA